MAVLTKDARLIVVGVTFSLSLSLVPVLAAGPASASASLSKQVTTAEVSSFLAVKATKMSQVVNASVNVCWYRVGANTQAAFVRVQTGDNKSGFNVQPSSGPTAIFPRRNDRRWSRDVRNQVFDTARWPLPSKVDW